MAWAHTGAIVALVEYPERFTLSDSTIRRIGDRAEVEYPRYAVRPFDLLAGRPFDGDADSAITAYGAVRPDPALPQFWTVGRYRTILIDLFPEAICEWARIVPVSARLAAILPRPGADVVRRDSHGCTAMSARRGYRLLSGFLVARRATKLAGALLNVPGVDSELAATNRAGDGDKIPGH